MRIHKNKKDSIEEEIKQFETDITNTQSEIARIDKEIDQIVYQLYGLSEEEIQIVENN